MPNATNVTGEWGSGAWGADAWGGGPAGPFVSSFVDVQVIRENCLRIEFPVPIYFSGILDPYDASNASYWSVDVQPSTGNDGEPAHAVAVAKVLLPDTADGVDAADFGRFVDLWLDRPMSPFPSRYNVQLLVTLASADFINAIPPAAFEVYGAFRKLQPATVTSPRPVRDLANPQTISTVPDGVAQGTILPDLGTFVADVTGDYAFDEGRASLKKRILRRLVTARGGFAHLPDYGVGIPSRVKKLASLLNIQDIAKDTEVQIAQEPEVAKVRVTAFTDVNRPGIVWFRIVVRTHDGRADGMNVPFERAAA